MTQARASADIIDRIMVAFGPRELPNNVPVFGSHYFEVDTKTLEALARQTPRWADLPRDVLGANPLATAFMTPAAFAWFLPAYMVTSIVLFHETDTLTSSLIGRLTPPDDEDARNYETLAKQSGQAVDESLLKLLRADDEKVQEFMDRVAPLTQNEKEAVREYLEYIDSEYGANFPASGPKQALDRYWART